MIVIGVDMGTKSTTISVIKKTRSKKTKKTIIRVLLCEMAPVSLTGMSAMELAKAKIFVDYFYKILDRYKPNLVSPELFMARSFRSNLGMPISFMIGIMYLECLKREIKFNAVMPASWKLALKRSFCDVEDVYDRSYPIKTRIPNHAFDSTLIALYNLTDGYKCTTLKQINRTVKQLSGFTFPPPLPAAGKKRKKRKKKSD